MCETKTDLLLLSWFTITVGCVLRCSSYDVWYFEKKRKMLLIVIIDKTSLLSDSPFSISYEPTCSLDKGALMFLCCLMWLCLVVALSLRLYLFEAISYLSEVPSFGWVWKLTSCGLTRFSSHFHVLPATAPSFKNCSCSTTLPQTQSGWFTS